MFNMRVSIFVTFIFLVITIARGQKPSLVQSQAPAPSLPKPVQTHLRFYWHDVLSGSNPTSVQIAEAPSTKTSTTGFGAMMMIDNPLTMEPNVSSQTVGRAQGFYASASKDTLGLLMTMNLVFTEGRYNGSTIGILGKNSAMTNVREMAVVGGTGVFRDAKGYCEARTHTFDPKTGDATVLYDVFVRHY